MNLLQNAIWSSAINFSDLWIMFAVTEKHYLPQNFIYAKKAKTSKGSLLLGLKMFSPVRRKVQRKHSISRQNKGNCQICVKLVTAGVSRCLLSRALKCFCCRAKVPQCKHSNIEGRNGLTRPIVICFCYAQKISSSIPFGYIAVPIMSYDKG